MFARLSLSLSKPQNKLKKKNTHQRTSSYAGYINTEINLTLRKAFVLSFYLNVAINLRSPWRYWLNYITCQQNRRSAPAKMTDNIKQKSKPLLNLQFLWKIVKERFHCRKMHGKKMKNPTNSLMKTNFVFRCAWSELELNKFFFAVIVCKGWCPWLNRTFKEKKSVYFIPTRLFWSSFFFTRRTSQPRTLSSDAPVARCNNFCFW